MTATPTLSAFPALKNKIKDMISAMMLTDPLLGIMLKRTWIYVDESLPSAAATDGLRIYVNPKLFLKFSDTVKLAILAHELMHIILKHNSRAKAVMSRHSLSQLEANFVADAKANQYLIEYFDVYQFVRPDDLAKVLGMSVSDVKTMSFEELCWELAKRKSELRQYQRGYAGRPGSNDIQQPIAGGEVLNEGDKEDVGVGDEEAVSERVVKKYSEALVTAKAIGRLPGWAERVFSEIVKPKINWKVMLKEMLTKGLGKKVKRTWARPSRKHPLYPGKEFLKHMNKVVVLMDTSGSIDEKELQQFASEVYYMVKNVAEVILIPWDADVHGEFAVRRPSDVRKLKVRGGGGTVIRPALELVNRKYAGRTIIILSDWQIADLGEPATEALLRRHARNIVAVTTSATPPSCLRNVIRIEV